MEGTSLQKISNTLSWLCCLAMFVGFLCSRATVSIASIILVSIALMPFNIQNTRQAIRSNIFVLACITMFGINVISLLWTQNMTVGWNEIITKLSWLAIPIGMTSVSIRNPKAFINLILLCNLALMLFVINSSIIYFSDQHEHIEAYMLYTTKYRDHIRFSLSVTLLLIANTYCIFQQKDTFRFKWLYLLLIIVSIYLIYYLHILSARTGLACLYVFLIAFLFYKLWLRNKWVSVVSTVAVLIFGFLAVKFIPRLNYKVAYMQYELRQWREADEAVQYTLSDNNRMLSYTVALSSIRKYPLSGVGAGDVQDEMVAIYNQKYPSIPQEGSLKLPHNQWLATAMATGVISCLVLLLVLISPIRKSYQHRYYLSITILVLSIAFMIDAMLEVQFGLFLFLFFIMLWQQHLPIKTKSI